MPVRAGRTFQRAGVLLALLFIVVCGWTLPVGAAPSSSAKNAPRDTLTPFTSEAQLRRYLKRARRTPPPPPAPPPPASAAPADGAAPAPAQEAAASTDAAGSTQPGITNTQEAGVDEGGIVKMHGDMLVILRRGRLFTVSTARGDLKPIDSINAFPPGVTGQGDWYDEMLVAGDRVIVIGYSYARGGTEINRFHIDDRGRLEFEDAYHLRSNDYYSSRNYASRLIGSKLIVYSPLYIPYGVEDPTDWFPALRRWTGDTRDRKAGFHRIVSARNIYIPRGWLNPEDSDVEAIHTVTTCDLAAPVLACDATSVLGPNGRVFYVSAHAVYVWVTPNRWWNRSERRDEPSLLYRMPLDGRAPSAVGVRGAPVDQFSFREDWDDGRLNVLVRSEASGDAMWSGEASSGAVALLRLPLNWFGDGDDEARRRHYQLLPKPSENSYDFQNRFVGDYVLYGTGNSWGNPKDRGSKLVVAAVRGSDVKEIRLSHGVDRIEAMGRDAIVVGSDTRDLFFQAVELTQGPEAALGDRYTLTGASQGETRSHAFFFKPEPRSDVGDNTAGVVGLPVARPGRAGFRHLVENSAAMIFIRRSKRMFDPLGELASSDLGVVDDDCKASCVDWYGNSRPIFLRGRTFALMGYEIVEGDLGPRSIREVRRISFAPGKR